jgi:ribosomal-protein-alanine N-acetyltransferase
MNLEGLPYALMPMGIDDIPTVSLIERNVFTLPWSTNAFTYEIKHNPASDYLVLKYIPWMEAKSKGGLSERVRRLFKPGEDVSLVGYGGFWILVDEAHICTIAIRPEWQGRGLGELLLLGLMEQAMKRDAQVVTLEVRVSNIKAQNLYLKCGFKAVGKRKGYYSDNREDALIMTTDAINTPAFQSRFQRLADQLRARLLSEPQQAPHLPQETE